MQKSSQILLTIAIVALLLCGVFSAFRTDPGTRKDEATSQNRTTHDVPGSVRSARVHRLTERTDSLQLPTTNAVQRSDGEIRRLFRQFYLADFAVSNVSPSDLIKMVQTEFQKLGGNSGDFVPIRFEADPALDGTAPIRLNVSNQTLTDVLNIIAAIVGGVIEIDHGTVSLVPDPELPEDDGTLLTHTFSVPPDFATQLADLANDPGISLITGSALAQMGLSISPDATIEFHPASSSLVTTASAPSLHKIANLVDALANLQEHQIYLAMKLVAAPSEPTNPTQEEIIEPAAFQSAVESLNSQQEVDLMSAPSIATRNRQAARVEVLREFFVPNANDPDQPAADSAGLLINIDPTFEGADVRLDGTVEFRLPPGQSVTGSIKELAQNGFSNDDIQSVTSVVTEFEIVMNEGNTACLRCKGSEDDREVLAFVTAERITPAGERLRSSPPE